MAMPRFLLQRAALALGVGVFLAILAPFGSDNSLLVFRFAYWVGAIAFGMVIGDVLAALLQRVWRPGWPLWLFALVLSLIITPPIAVAVALVEIGLGGDGVRRADIPAHLFAVWVICIAMSGLGVLMDAAHRAKEAEAAGAEGDSGETFRRRLKPKLRAAAIWAVSAEDHYLRVRTEAGEEMILMRLADAETELAGVPGLRVHRSWWVGETGVERVRREPGGRATIVLKDGAEAPVSRTYRPALREAGWL